ncbi:glycogen synthase GlgA (plasmid) [Ensifer adhaerens]|uniref:glycogen synthase GlgA n=1 Tax=Ensifer adhaerens TaxID=106592 RepID=UPI001CC1355E|nr:glycogen synthase GlgA [Ensifer adhaerens]MBZ7927653.1 glycogen synthase GlgA [Ensifer adhaerens]UAX98049.1 glycogen synthase GlgA [Ensifer adhaerens]UAY05430.1 glycogen synthase GlgA [Ensifer adhaerens]UAY12808.1 glycogen synthase GlgA [Ensifer adhaerens]
MQILAVAAEIYPLIKTGGLADVTGSLPKALKQFGVHTRTLVPGYPEVLAALEGSSVLRHYGNVFGVEGRLLGGRARGLDIIVFDAPELFVRSGGPYGPCGTLGYEDNWKRFAAFSWVASDIAERGLAGWYPSLVHAHDWHSALALAYLKYCGNGDIPRILTLHNLSFQGQFPARHFAELGLPDECYGADCLEYYGDISYLKAGLTSADTITVVSPTYAREIMSPTQGMGLEGVINARRDDVVGIVNGIDTDIWDPSCDPHIEHHYSARVPLRRLANRATLLKSLGLPQTRGLVFASVNRLTWQKGMDLLAGLVDEIADLGGKLIVHGQGDHAIEQLFLRAADRHPRHVAVVIGYDEALAHRIHAGADAMLVPSRFEPCGLTQLYALRYGCVPIVSRTGGLAETVIDANDAAVHARAATGIQFAPIDAGGLRHALHRAFKLHRRHRGWEKLCRQAMKADCSWARSASQYIEVYGNALSQGGLLRESA